MTTIVTRAGKGSPLSWSEVDANFTNLNTNKAEVSVVNLKAPIDSPSFTGTVSGVTSTMVGLGNVDNTSDATKNAATATLTNKTIAASTNTVEAMSGPNNSPLSFRNKLINGEVTRINQRGVVNWAAVANGAYGYDRWKKIDASNMTQIIEAGNFRPSTVHTLSGVGVTTQQITSPASGNWTLPNIPITATNVQLEEGLEATPFEVRHIALELEMCQRYLPVITDGAFGSGYFANATSGVIYTPFKVQPRVKPSGITTAGTVTTNSALGSIAVSTSYNGNTGLSGAYINITGSGFTAGQAFCVILSGAPILFTGCEL